MALDWTGKVAVITGGASGIGRSVALAAARRGCDVVLADIDDGGMARVAGEVEALVRRALAVRCDVTKDPDVDALAQQAIGWQEHIDLLMNNAGAAVGGLLEALSMADWDWQLQLNLYGVIRTARAFMAHFMARGSGAIVNTSSMAGLSGPPILAAYVTSKHAVIGFSEALANYLRPRGITVSVLCPDAVDTPIWDRVRRVQGTQGEGMGQVTVRDHAAMRSPDEVAERLFAALDEDRFVVLTVPPGTNPRAEARAAAIEAMALRTAAAQPA
ncbi:MAG TPA: SDR family oxidoreductase [Dehalococcoidia bacterium]|jgi:NAD(P)-dependent dehydrogenase (short-subunit alcohol dehydrogenase family)